MSPLQYLAARVIRARVNRLSKASDPGLIRLSQEKLRRFSPKDFEGGWNPLAWLDRRFGDRATRIFLVADHLIHGDSRAAVVLSVSPLLVAAYTDELDCIAMLQFPGDFVSEFKLRVGSRLLTVNRYVREGPLAGDLEHGPASYHRYVNFLPLIANFLSDDLDRIESRIASIAEPEWARTIALGRRSLAKFGDRARDGRPSRCLVPAEAKPLAWPPSPSSDPLWDEDVDR
jgi:hypothetical protein